MTFLLLVIGGVIISVVVGTFWYSSGTPMGKLHMRYLGLDKLSDEERKKKMEEGKAMMSKMYAAQMALSLLIAFGTVFIVRLSVQNGVPLALAIGFVAFNWLCFMLPVVGIGILWSNCDRKIAWKKFASDSLSQLVTVVLIALLAGLVA